MKKYKLINNVSSLYKLNYALSDVNIYIKREDTLDFSFGGNKVRLWEYIAQNVIEKKSDKIITFGSAYSNHIRVAASVAARLKIKCDLIILVNEDEYDGPNLKIASSYKNVKISLCKTEEANQYIDDYLLAQNCNYFWVPGGGHMARAALGYRDLANELLEQINNLDLKIDSIFLPCGTGTSQAGLIYGLNNTIPVRGISVARSSERCKCEIRNLLSTINEIENVYDEDKMTSMLSSVDVIANDTRKYGVINFEIRKMIQELAVSDGVFLDPIYNAKTFLKMIEHINHNKKFSNVLYINTGGTPNITIL